MCFSFFVCGMSGVRNVLFLPRTTRNRGALPGRAGLTTRQTAAAVRGHLISEVCSAHVQTRYTQHDHQEDEAAENRAVNIEFDSTLREVVSVGAGGYCFLLGKPIRADV